MEHNIMSEYGMSDIEICKEQGLDPQVAGTPRINDLMIEKVFNDNVRDQTEGNISKGMDPSKANKKALAFAKQSRSAANQNLKKVQKARGY